MGSVLVPVAFSSLSESNEIDLREQNALLTPAVRSFVVLFAVVICYCCIIGVVIVVVAVAAVVIIVAVNIVIGVGFAIFVGRCSLKNRNAFSAGCATYFAIVTTAFGPGCPP